MGAGERKKFAVFDVDGTLIRWQLYHAIVNELAKRGHLSAATYDHIRASRRQWKSRTHNESFKDYEQALIDAYHTALTKLKVADYMSAVERVFEEHKDQVYTYTRDLLKKLKSQGYMLFTISGSQQEVIQKLARYYGFDDAVGNHYERKNGYFTGELNNVIERKADLLAELVDRHDCDWRGSIGVGDSEGDIELLSAVETPIAFNPSKRLFEHARRHGWQIVVERKNVIYELEPRDGTYVLGQAGR